MSDATSHTRMRRKYFAARFSLESTDLDVDVNNAAELFMSENPGSERFSATRGFDDGTRYNVRINPEGSPIWVKYNDADNDSIYIAGDAVFEEFNVLIRNLYFTSADEGVAQIDRVVFAADSSGSYNNTYFKLYARNTTTLEETVYGIWYNINSAGVQPVDSEVDVWAEVAADTDATGDTLATATEAVVDALTGAPFASTPTTSTLDITHSVAGVRKPAVDVGTPATVSTPTPGEGTATTVNLRVC